MFVPAFSSEAMLNRKHLMPIVNPDKAGNPLKHPAAKAPRIFADTATRSEIEPLFRAGIINGVTTNPSLLKKAGAKSWDHAKEIMKDLCTMLRGFAAPRSAAVPSAPPAAAHPAGAQPDDGAPTLLLVDDEVNILRALTRMLHGDGYRVLSTTSAAEALRLLGETTVHVIVSDQRMPEMHGTDFLAAAERACPHSVRILLSGFSGAVEAMDAINRGIVHKYLTKPWTDADLRAQLRDAFELAGVCMLDRAA